MMRRHPLNRDGRHGTAMRRLGRLVGMRCRRPAFAARLARSRSPSRRWSSCAAIAARLTFRDYGLGWDDYTHAQYGDLLLALYASGFADTARALASSISICTAAASTCSPRSLRKSLPFDLFETRRLVGAAVGLVGLSPPGASAGGSAARSAGLVALVLLATCPLYYGHMFINPKDAPFAVAMALLPARPRARASRNIRSRRPRPSLIARHRLRPVDRLAHHGGFGALYALLRARAAGRDARRARGLRAAGARGSAASC